MALDAIRSITVDVPGLEGLLGRNPRGVYKEEEVVEALRGVLARDQSFYFEDKGQAGGRFKLTPDPKQEGSYRILPEEERVESAQVS